jgi:hypothetical protein
MDMIGDIQKLLEARPFEAFEVVTSAGQHYRVASPEHADVNPKGSRLVIWFDDDSSVMISRLHIAAVELGNHRPT